METKPIKTILVRVAAFVMLSGCMFADSLEWGGTWTGVWSGFGTGPYTANDYTRSEKLTIFCLDFNDEIAPPYNWNANIYALNQANVNTYAQFGGNYPVPGVLAAPFAFQGDTIAGSIHNVTMNAASSTAYTRYLEAAWLFSNILQAGGDLNTEIISQVAAWDLLVDSHHIDQLTNDIRGTGGSYTFNNYLYSTNSYASVSTKSIAGLSFEEAVNEALNGAQNAVTSENWAASGFMDSWNLVTGDPTWVLTTGNGVPAQEFLTPSLPPQGNNNPLVPNPEPGAIVLMGSALFLLGWSQRRRYARISIR